MTKEALAKIRELDQEFDDVQFWVQCPEYTDEVVNMKTEYLDDNNGRVVANVTFLFHGIGEHKVSKDIIKWKRLITELNTNEMKYQKLKREYDKKEFDILVNFDFKKKYGKDNEKLRNLHVRSELADERKELKDLEVEIDYQKRMVSFYNQLVATKTSIFNDSVA